MTANVFKAPERPQCLKTRQLNRSNIMCRSRSNRLHCNETVWGEKGMEPSFSYLYFAYS